MGLHGLPSSHAGVSELLSQREINLFIGLETMCKHNKSVGAPFLPVVNKGNQSKYGTAIAVNPTLHPNIKSAAQINCVQTSTSVTLRLQNCTIIGIYLPRENAMEVLTEILPSITDFNFDPLSQHLSTA